MSLGAKIQPVFILTAAIIGLILGRLTNVGQISTGYIEVFLMLLLYILFLSVDVSQLKKAFGNIKYTGAAFGINFLVTPILAFILGNVFFPESIEIRIGLLLLLVTPCTDWYLVFTGLSKGNVALNLSILPMNLVAQILLMPVYLFIFLGSEVQMNILGMLQSIVSVLLVPFIGAQITSKIIKNKAMTKDWITQHGDNLQLLFLCLAVAVMFASESSSLFENPILLLELFIPLILFFTIILVIAQCVGRMLHFDKPDIVALNFTTLARNSPLSLAIAVVTFPDYPLTSLALVIGPLIELPILSLISSILARWNRT